VLTTFMCRWPLNLRILLDSLWTYNKPVFQGFALVGCKATYIGNRLPRFRIYSLSHLQWSSSAAVFD
jgi:hypothetical protein